MDNQKITRPALRYPGGKWRLASWIISFFPPHDCYVEPYGGAASVLLQKPPAPYEVYNDLEDDVVNFFRVLRERHDEFLQAVELTPWSRREFELATVPVADPLERARRFFVRCWQSHSGGGLSKWSTGWRYQKTASSNKPATDSWNEMEHLRVIAQRLKRTQIEHDDALAVIARFDSAQTLFYVDPPYVPDSRSKWKKSMYRLEMDDDDHRRLAAVLHAVEGMVILSGYPSTLYETLYADWHREEIESRTNFTNLRTEAIWISPRAMARRGVQQIRLF